MLNSVLGIHCMALGAGSRCRILPQSLGIGRVGPGSPLSCDKPSIHSLGNFIPASVRLASVNVVVLHNDLYIAGGLLLLIPAVHPLWVLFSYFASASMLSWGLSEKNAKL